MRELEMTFLFKPRGIWIGMLSALLVFSTQVAHAQKRSRFRSGSEVRSQNNSRPRIIRSDANHNIVRENGRNVIYKKRNVVDLDENLLEGELKNPDDFYFVHRPEEKFGSLVKKRKNFHKEMLRDTVMIR